MQITLIFQIQTSRKFSPAKRYHITYVIHMYEKAHMGGEFFKIALRQWNCALSFACTLLFGTDLRREKFPLLSNLITVQYYHPLNTWWCWKIQMVEKGFIICTFPLTKMNSIQMLDNIFYRLVVWKFYFKSNFFIRTNHTTLLI